MISRDVVSLATYLRHRARSDEPLDAAELHQVAAMIDAWVPAIEATESRPVPAGWRVIPGGRCAKPSPGIA